MKMQYLISVCTLLELQVSIAKKTGEEQKVRKKVRDQVQCSLNLISFVSASFRQFPHLCTRNDNFLCIAVCVGYFTCFASLRG